MARKPPTSGRGQQLRHILSLIDQQGQGPAGPVGWGTETLRPEFAYPGDPRRNPFEAPLGVMQERAAGPVDARGVGIAPEILQAMKLMRARQAMGFQTTGDQVQADFRRRHPQGVSSPLWG